MKNLLPHFFLLLLAIGQSCSSDPLGGNGAHKPRLTEFVSDDPELKNAAEKAVAHLEKQQVDADSFYLEGIENKKGSVVLTLQHYKLKKHIEELKKESTGDWIVFPPLQSMPAQYKELEYVFEADSIVDHSVP